jgi:hypothetical protein
LVFGKLEKTEIALIVISAIAVISKLKFYEQYGVDEYYLYDPEDMG